MLGAIPLNDKSRKRTTTAFKKLIETSKKNQKNWSDRGKDIFNKTFLELLKQNEIQLYSTHSVLKAVIVERFNISYKRTKVYRR